MAKTFSKWRYGVRLPLFFFLLVALSSCATSLNKQFEINNLAARSDYSRAISVLDDNPSAYGKNNALLYFLDRGILFHLTNDYKQSSDAFEEGKRKFDELYTKSVTRILSSWLANDYTLPYTGEDFERVMINIFEALNYVMLGDLDEALVEARDVDIALKAINNLYGPDQKNVYREDAFARLLMGILYEARMTRQDYNDAFISYKKAVEIYEGDYARNYNLEVPQLLKENILAAAQAMGPVEFSQYRFKYGSMPFASLEEKAKKAEVYLIQYNGLCAVKEEGRLPIPLPDGYIVQISFPFYQNRLYRTRAAVLMAQDEQGKIFKASTAVGEDIDAIAKKNLDNRKVRVIAKAVTSSVAKYLIERKQEENIRKKFGEGAGDCFKILSSLFNVLSSRADIRCWRTLPSQIRIGRLILEPGEYHLSVTAEDISGKPVETIDLGSITVSAAEEKFFIVRTPQ